MKGSLILQLRSKHMILKCFFNVFSCFFLQSFNYITFTIEVLLNYYKHLWDVISLCVEIVSGG